MSNKNATTQSGNCFDDCIAILDSEILVLKPEKVLMHFEKNTTLILENKNNSNNSNLYVFPNPNNGSCKISSDVNMEMNIVNQLGQIILFVSLDESNNRQSNLSNLANGVYFLTSRNPQQKINQKIVVIK